MKFWHKKDFWYGVILVALVLAAVLLWWLKRAPAPAPPPPPPVTPQAPKKPLPPPPPPPVAVVTNLPATPPVAAVEAPPPTPPPAAPAQPRRPRKVGTSSYPTRRVVAYPEATGKSSGFSSPVEAQINALVRTKKGMRPPLLPPLPPGTDIEKMLNTDILVYDDDDDTTVDAKIAVAKTKEALAEYLAEGGQIEDFLAHYQIQLHEAYLYRDAAYQEMMTLLREGEADAAELYVIEANKLLEKEGMPPLKFSPKLADFLKKRAEERKKATQP